MWRTSDGVVHVNRIATPGDYLDPMLKNRLDKLTDPEKVSLYYALGQQVDECVAKFALSSEYDAQVEASFDAQWLPENYRLADDASKTPEALTMSQAGLVPDRWKVEFISLVPNYLLDTGPSWRRWKRIMRKLGVDESSGQKGRPVQHHTRGVTLGPCPQFGLATR